MYECLLLRLMFSGMIGIMFPWVLSFPPPLNIKELLPEQIPTSPLYISSVGDCLSA